MNNLINIFVLFGFIGFSIAEPLACDREKVEHSKAPWKDMVKSCTKLMEQQVQKETQASVNYLSMAIHYSRDDYNRLGFSEFYLESAKEEREHAIKFMEYLLMRGGLTEELAKIIEIAVIPVKENWGSPLESLRYALEMETNVTQSIQNIMTNCENPPNNTFNDYHLVDHLTTEFLEEQYRGQRDLAGKISTLGKMMNDQGLLGEFLFDQKLLKK